MILHRLPIDLPSLMVIEALHAPAGIVDNISEVDVVCPSCMIWK